MADIPDDDEQETFVQKAVKIGLIAIPLMMYVSWAHKKFVPCPRVKCHQARPPLFKTSVEKGKRKNEKGKCQDSRPGKQDHTRENCDTSRSAKQEHMSGKYQDSQPSEPHYHDQLPWLFETNEKEMEPSKDKYMDYLKHSTSECYKSVNKNVERKCSTSECYKSVNKNVERKCSTSECCKSVNKNVEGYSNANKTDYEQTEADPCQSNTQSETISPEAFDKLFEQHFQECVNDFKQHKQQLEKELERLKDDCDTKQNIEKPESNKNGNYLKCLTDFNLDKDFECDPNFHSKDSDAPYVVKDYKCKVTKGKATKENESDPNDTCRTRYLKCLTDLNMDKHFEEKRETQSIIEEKSSKNECCPRSEVNGYNDNAQKKTDECETDSYNKTKKNDNHGTTKEDPYPRKTQEEETCEKETESSEHKPKSTLEKYNSYTNVETDDCGCDPHFNTKDTGKYGTIKGDPCTLKSAREYDTDDDALKDFWHACGPPKGLRSGCQTEGCNDSCDKRK